MTITVTRSAGEPWMPLIEPGVETSGIEVKALRRDREGGRAPTFLLRFAPGASYPNHVHPAGEEVYVLEGRVRFGAVELAEGDYLFTPPGESHAVHSASGCTLLLVVPQEVEITRNSAPSK